MEGQFSDLRSSSQDSQSTTMKNSQNTRDRYTISKKHSIIDCKTLPKHQESKSSSINIIKQDEYDQREKQQPREKISHIRSESQKEDLALSRFKMTNQLQIKKNEGSQNSSNFLAIDYIDQSDEDDSVLKELNDILSTAPSNKASKLPIQNTNTDLLRPITSSLTNFQYRTQHITNQNQVFSVKKQANKTQSKFGSQITKTQPLFTNRILSSPRSVKSINGLQKQVLSKKPKKQLFSTNVIMKSNQQLNLPNQVYPMQLNQFYASLSKPKTSSLHKTLGTRNFAINFGGTQQLNDKMFITQWQNTAGTQNYRHTLAGFQNYNVPSARRSQ